MDIKSEFKSSPHPRVTAAQIGINKLDWICLDSKYDEQARSLMSQNKFDILPIINEKGSFEQYYATRQWNDYTALNLNNIDLGSTIYYGTGIRDLIKRFHKEKRYFYFLSDYQEIVGLVSFANLSCQAVYNYLYYIISSIENGVSGFLQKRIDDQLILKLFEEKSSEKSLVDVKDTNHYQNTLNRYNRDNQEYSIYSYLDFKDLGLIITRNDKYLTGKEKKLKKYYAKFEGSYNDLRQKVMHPVKTLLTTPQSVAEIDELLDDYDSIMEIVSISSKVNSINHDK